jgi:SAM-dependent methyltransferase
MPHKYKNCIEIGGGSGFFSSRFGCIDVDPAWRMLLRAKLRGVDAVQAVGEKMPIRDNSVDVALIIVTICFVDEPELLVQEAARILRRGGFIVACIVPRDSPWGIYYISRRHMSPFYRYARFYTVSEIEDMLQRNNLAIVDRLATLSYKPWEPPRYEAPSRRLYGRGFVCIKAVKRQ